MSSTRKPLDGLAIGIIVTLCFCWGLQQVAIKVAAPMISPVMQIALRSAVAAVLVLGFMRWRGIPVLKPDGTLVPGLVAGVLFGLEFLLIALGLGYTSASHMVVFIYTAPIFAALGLHLWVAGEQLSSRQWVGVLIAFGGVVAAFSEGLKAPANEYPLMWLGDFLGLIAGLFWGLTTVVIRATALSEAPPTKTLLYQLLLAVVILFGYAFATGTHSFTIGTFTPLIWASLTFQILVVGFVSLMLWFWMLRHYLASRVSVFTFLTPLFGIILGVWLLDEPLTPGFVLGSLLIVVGITFVNWPVRKAAG